MCEKYKSFLQWNTKYFLQEVLSVLYFGSATKFAEHLKFCKIPNVRAQELSEEKTSFSLEKDFIFRFHIYFSASFALLPSSFRYIIWNSRDGFF